ncbi:lysozyme [Algoriphagus resistens]|uniref:lysozyme n=1 Tax=Algoriphagus resistens TaxID=1750590 RepID=UPI0007169010|nr:lysozyme [Algoriphagus resistens]
MKTNKAGIAILHEFESCKLKAYKCPAGVWTIGWGNTFYEDGSKVREGDMITKDRADALFQNILSRFEDMARRSITSNVNENQFSAFVSALYNVGHGSKYKDGLIVLKNGEPSTLLKTINLNPDLPVIEKLFKEWISKGTSFEKGLLRRRTAEANLYFS